MTAKTELARTIAEQLFFDKLLPPDAELAEIMGAIEGVLPDAPRSRVGERETV